MNNRSWL